MALAPDPWTVHEPAALMDGRSGPPERPSAPAPVAIPVTQSRPRFALPAAAAAALLLIAAIGWVLLKKDDPPQVTPDDANTATAPPAQEEPRKPEPVSELADAPSPAERATEQQEQPEQEQPEQEQPEQKRPEPEPEREVLQDPTQNAVAPSVVPVFEESTNTPQGTGAPDVEDGREERDEDASDRLVALARSKARAGGDTAEQISLLEQALAFDARNPRATAMLAKIYLGQRDAERAVEYAEKSVQLRPRRASYRVLHGDALSLLGKEQAARAAWQKAVELDPESSAAARLR